jgi:hypothetical protein
MGFHAAPKKVNFGRHGHEVMCAGHMAISMFARGL